MTAHDAVHLRMMLAEDMHGPYFYQMADDMYREAMGKGPRGTLPTPQQVNYWSGADSMIAHMARALSVAETFFLSQNMGRVCKVAAQRLPVDEPVQAHDPYSPSGFMYLAEPFTTLDIRGMPISTDALLWTTVGTQIVIWCLTDKNNPVDGSNQVSRSHLGEAGWMKMPRLTLGHILWLKVGEPTPQSITWSNPLPPEIAHELKLEVLDAGGGRQAIAWRGPNGEALDLQGGTVIGPDEFARFVHTVWRLMQQTLASLEHEEAPRSMRRQLARHQIPSGIVVVQLRRKAGHPYPTAGEPLAWRQLVTGHWKNQWYPSLGIHQRIYVDPYVRGPEDAPFSQTKIVRAIVR